MFLFLFSIPVIIVIIIFILLGSNLDSAMSYFQGIQETIESQTTTKDIEFLQLDVSLVAAGVSRQAQLWKSDYGDVLLATSRANLVGLQERIRLYREHLNKDTTIVEDLKFVLNNISDIASASQEVDLDMMDILERYRTLQRYSIEVPPAELESALNIQDFWYQLFIESKTCDLRLNETKLLFKDVTLKNDADFRKSTVDIRNSFLDSGPGISSISLDDGLNLVKEYNTKLKSLSKQKQELINAQMLLGIDISSYSTLLQLQSEVDTLEKIYSFYESFREFQNTMGNSLWSELDSESLQKGIDDFDTQLKRFPKELKEIYTFKRVEEYLHNFQEAIPLVVNLKVITQFLCFVLC
jgi:hypothetical protein